MPARPRVVAVHRERGDGSCESSEAKPATDLLGKRRRCIPDNDYVHCCPAAIEGHKQHRTVTDPKVVIQDATTYKLTPRQGRFRRLAHRANHFVTRHAFLDLLKCCQGHARPACNPQPASEARKHCRGKQHTESAATGHICPFSRAAAGRTSWCSIPCCKLSPRRRQWGDVGIGRRPDREDHTEPRQTTSHC